MPKKKTRISPQFPASPCRTRKRKTVKSVSHRGYNGIIQGRLSPYKGEYRTTDQILYAEHGELISRARELAQNDGTVIKYKKLLSANVVGPQGIRVVPKAADPSGKLDSLANEVLAKCFYEWAKYPTVDNTLSWVDVQRICLESLPDDGEVFIRIYRGKDFGKYHFQLQLLPPDFVDVRFNGFSNGNEIINGIEYNRYGRPVAYYVYNHNPKDTTKVEPLTRTRLTEHEIIHFFVKERADQNRGIPRIAPVMAQMLDLKHYKYLELVNARVQAGTQGFITQPDKGPSRYRGQTEDKLSQSIIVDSGTIQQLPPGCDIKTYDPSHPSSNYPGYVKSQARDISSGLNASYNDLYSDLEAVTYSSLRWGALSDRDQYKMLQRILIDTVIEPVYLYFVEMATLANKLTDGKITLPFSKINKYSSAQFRPRSFPWIDPQKDQAAITSALANQTTTLTKVLEEEGYDLEDVLKEREKEKELSQKYGVDFSHIYKTGAPNAKPIE